MNGRPRFGPRAGYTALVAFRGLEGTRPYHGAAWYYAEYRPRLSAAFIHLLVERFGLDRTHRVLDLGSGPGQVALRLAPHVREVVALDPERDMIAEGERRARALDLANVSFMLGGSEDLCRLRDEIGRFRAVTIGEAFHWMLDQDLVLRDLDPLVDAREGAVLLITTGRILWEDERIAAARKLVGDLLARYLANVPPGPHPRGRHDAFEAILARSPFPRLDEVRVEYDVDEAATPEALVGYEYTISHTLRALGERRAAFEAEGGRRCQASSRGRFACAGRTRPS